MQKTIQEFYDLMKEEVLKKLDDVTISQNKIVKNNGVSLLGMLIKKEGEQVSPNIYMEKYYDLYTKDTELEFIVNQLIKDYKHSIVEAPGYITENILVYENIKDRIFYKIIGTDTNQELLLNSPHQLFGDDFALVYCILAESHNNQIGTIKITHNILHELGINENVLFEIADANTPKLFPSTINSMNDMIFGLMNGDTKENTIDDFDLSKGMHVLTNAQGINGASVIAYPGLLHTIYNHFGVDYVILPSSVHEVIILPLDQITGDINSMSQMVSEINGAQVAPEEVLSNKAYLYSEFIQRIQASDAWRPEVVIS